MNNKLTSSTIILEKKRYLYEKIISIAICSYPILSIYKIGPIPLSFLIVLFILVFEYVFGYKRIFKNKSFLIFMVLVFFQHVITVFLYKNNVKIITNLASLVSSFLFIILVSSSGLGKKTFLKIYTIFAILSAVGIFYQSFFVYILDESVGPLVFRPFIAYPDLVVNTLNRPMSFFPEPQAFASYVIPLFFLQIKRKKYPLVVFLLASIILSGSSLGIIAALLIVIISVPSLDIKAIHKTGLVMMVLFIFAIFMLSPIFEYSREKLFTIDFSNNQRLTSGFYNYTQISTFEKIFGVGRGNFLTHYPSANTEYMTTFSSLLVYNGILVTISFMCFLLSIFFNGSREVKHFVVIYFILTFGQTILFNPIGDFYMFIIIFIYTFRKEVSSYDKEESF